MIPSFCSDQSHSRQPAHKSELMISLHGILFSAAKENSVLNSPFHPSEDKNGSSGRNLAQVIFTAEQTSILIDLLMVYKLCTVGHLKQDWLRIKTGYKM